MPRCVVRLRPKGWRDLEDPLEDSDHRLLVELRALCKVCSPPEIVDAEHVGATLGRRANDLRRKDLGEALVAQYAPKTCNGRGRQSEERALSGMSEPNGSVIQQRRQVRGDMRPVQLEWRWLDRLRHHFDAFANQLHSARSLWRRYYLALDPEDRFGRQRRDELHQLRRIEDRL